MHTEDISVWRFMLGVKSNLYILKILEDQIF